MISQAAAAGNAAAAPVRLLRVQGHALVTLQRSPACPHRFFSCPGTDRRRGSLSAKHGGSMATESGIGTEPSDAPGSLEKFHLGLAADGMTCALVFVDERHRSI